MQLGGRVTQSVSQSAPDELQNDIANQWDEQNAAPSSVRL